ncbi:aminotransferase AlaT [Platysternon megacephalum]|uniref:Aminotransferase AlaT n=1 Tax=Platysternon megacephalum TaxID=55544 RepID=A0A4D9DK07_9SAUR|nr:aminotransferase AlaT [Platysternon megacephalum]
MGLGDRYRLCLLLALGGSAAAWVDLSRSPRVPEAGVGELTQCDFDDSEHPFCHWTRPDAGDWVRAQGLAPGDSPGPPGGTPERAGFYVVPAARAPGPVELRSPELEGASAVCLEFLYYMYGVGEGSWLAVLPQGPAGYGAPQWNQTGPQSSAWLRGAVTLSAPPERPFKVVFRAARVPGFDLALDSVSIQLGPCSPCVTGCDFDTLDDLCGWQSPPGTGSARWEQWVGAGDQAGVGPQDDFSKPGIGYYMLMEFLEPEAGGSALLRSPPYPSPGGCLALSFYYIVHGKSPSATLNVYAAPAGATGADLGTPLLSLRGDQGADWQRGLVNYTGSSEIQFVFQGSYAEKPEPGLAVDSVRVWPCEETFTQCDFNNASNPLCGWAQPDDDDGDWIRTNQPTATEETGPPGDYPHGEGYYIYAEAGSLRPGQSMRLVSRDFCTADAVCVEFYYYMAGIVQTETQLRVLAWGPSGPGLPLWTRTGLQSPAWLLGSVTVPAGRLQPTRIAVEVVRGDLPYLDVALDNVSVRRGPCPGAPVTPPTTAPTSPGGPGSSSAGTATPSGTTAMRPTATATVATGSAPTGTTATTTIASGSAPTGTTATTTVATGSAPTGPTATTTVATGTAPTGTTATTTVATGTSPTGTTATTTVATGSSLTGTTATTTVATGTAPTGTTATTTVATGSAASGTTASTTIATGSAPSGTTATTTVATGSAPSGTTATTTVATGTAPTGTTATTTVATGSAPTGTTATTPIATGSAPSGTAASTTVATGSAPTGTTATTTIATGSSPSGTTATTSIATSSAPSGTTTTSPIATGTGTAPTGTTATSPIATGSAPSGTTATTTVATGSAPTSGSPAPSVTPSTPPGASPNGGGGLAPAPFAVHAANEHRHGQGAVTYVRAVFLELPGATVTLLKNRVVQVNGSRVTLPAVPAPGVSVRLSGTFAEVRTDFGLVVRYDGDHYAEVRVSRQYRGALCGLCGDYNGDPGDDFRTPSGGAAGSAGEFGDSWGVGNCTLAGPPVTPQCPADARLEYEGPGACGILLAPDGPFAPCHGQLSPTIFFRDCVFDLCALGGDRRQLCSALGTYGTQCQAHNISLGPWRNQTLCREWGRGAGLGEEFFGPGCGSRCRCEGGNRTHCQAWQCRPTETCGLHNGLYGCHPTGNAHPTDPPCPTGPWFSVEGKNEARGRQGVSYLRTVYVSLPGASLTLLKGQRTLINGTRVTLPARPTRDSSVARSGQYVAVETSFGLALRWDGNHFLEIRAPRCRPDASDKPICTPGGEITASCDRIRDPQGAFRDCHKLVPPTPYLENCLFDMCQYQGLRETLCGQLQAYTAACQAAGAPLGEVWYNAECSEKCTCQGQDDIQCQAAQCQPQELCQRREGDSPCQNEGWCQETPSGYECHCPEGYAGGLCDQVTDDVAPESPAPPGHLTAILTLADLVGDVPAPPGPRSPPAGSRPLRDSPEPPSLDPAWARFFADFMTGQRKFRGRTRKAPAPQGCFGVKLDRIGTLSGLGC